MSHDVEISMSKTGGLSCTEVISEKSYESQDRAFSRAKNISKQYEGSVVAVTYRSPYRTSYEKRLDVSHYFSNGENVSLEVALAQADFQPRSVETYEPKNDKFNSFYLDTYNTPAWPMLRAQTYHYKGDDGHKTWRETLVDGTVRYFHNAKEITFIEFEDIRERARASIARRRGHFHHENVYVNVPRLAHRYDSVEGMLHRFGDVAPYIGKMAEMSSSISDETRDALFTLQEEIVAAVSKATARIQEGNRVQS